MNVNHELVSRPSNAEDLSYVYDTWLNSWRTSPWAGCVPNHLFHDTQRATIAGLLARGASVRIAHFPASPELIQGWCCFEIKGGVTILHYLYAADPFLAPAIIEHFQDTALGRTGFITHQQNKKAFRKWKHVPEIARRKSL
jgi:hypothetical protein